MTRSGCAPQQEHRRSIFTTGYLRELVLIALALALSLALSLAFAGVARPSSAAGADSPATPDDTETQPSRYAVPFTEGVAGADAWVGVDEIHGDTLGTPGWLDADIHLEHPADTVDPHPVRLIPPGSRPVPMIPEIPMRLSRAGVGAYAGYPSAVGALVSAPVDGPLGARFGLAAFPGVGVAWSPGFEVRFGQERGTYSRDGYHIYGNLLFGRTYLGGDKERTSMEAGLGYRWVVSDRQGLRWIAAAEFGGRWTSDSGWPDRPGLRVYWLFADW